VVLIAVGAFMDASPTISPAERFYLSQALIGFASLLFLAQAVAIGFARMRSRAASSSSFVVLLRSVRVSAGSWVAHCSGPSRYFARKFIRHELVQSIVVSDPLVAAAFRPVRRN